MMAAIIVTVAIELAKKRRRWCACGATLEQNRLRGKVSGQIPRVAKVFHSRAPFRHVDIVREWSFYRDGGNRRPRAAGTADSVRPDLGGRCRRDRILSHRRRCRCDRRDGPYSGGGGGAARHLHRRLRPASQSQPVRADGHGRLPRAGLWRNRDGIVGRRDDLRRRCGRGDCRFRGGAYAASQESLDKVGNLWPLLLLAAPMLAAPMLVAVSVFHQGAGAVAVYLLLAVWIAAAVYLLARRPVAGSVSRAVGWLIAGISLCDAAILASTGAIMPALAAIGGFVLTLIAQKYVPGT
jgi:hypothetical protein